MTRRPAVWGAAALLSISLAVGAAAAAPPRGPSPSVPCSAWMDRFGAGAQGPEASSPLSGGRPGDTLCDIPVPQSPRPPYLVPVADSVLGGVIERITNDPGLPTTPLPGTWGNDARHVYSTQQPWSSDNTLLSIENRGGSPSPLILDGSTYAPKLAPCPNYPFYDYRWHPSHLHPHEQINVDSSGTELMWFDVVDCIKTRLWTLPIKVNYGIGSGDGNPSQDGRFVALGNDSAMFVVDMDPQPPFAPYPSRRIGPVYSFPPCSLSTSNPGDCTIGNLSVSPSGRYVDVKYTSGSDTTADVHRVYEVDPATLALAPHRMATASLRCGSFGGRPNGWIFPLKHSDMALDPFDGNQDVIVGGRSCPGASMGRVVKVRLSDGRVTPLTDPSNEASVSHVSTRNLERPGWAYVSYLKVEGKCFSDEVVAVKLDGSRSVERIAHKHSLTTGCYRCESHPVPSRDGERVLFASNWAEDCGVGCGSTSDIMDYVVTTSGPPSSTTGQDPGLVLNGIYPNPARFMPAIVYSVAARGPVRLEVVDVAGRRVLRRDLGSPDPGCHVASLGEGLGPAPGIYWLRLSQEKRRASAAVVFIR